MKTFTDLSRRQFLKNAAAMAAIATLPTFWFESCMTTAAPAPKKVAAGQKVNLACCGIGNRGGEITRELYKTGLCNIVALCDTDMGAEHTKKVLEQFPDVPRYQDFRVMFKEMADKIDAVSVGVPDHSHFPICMLAMKQGIHVYVEKPMARSFHQIEILMQAAKKFGVVTQMGNQGHSEANYFQFKAWKEAGIIKDVTEITAHMNSPRRWHGWDSNMTSFPAAEPIPETLNWDIWAGVEPMKEYNHDYVNGQWRCWYDLGLGALGDWGAHLIDTAHEFLELGYPTEVNMLRAEGHNPFFFPFSSTIEFKFPERKEMPPVTITWYDGLDNIPAVPEGYGVSEIDPNIPTVAGGKIQPAKLNPGKIIYSKELTFKGGSHGSTLSIIPEEKAKEMESKLPAVPESTSNHYANFLLAVRGEEQTRSPFDIAGPLSQVFCLGVIAQKLNAKLQFDPATKKFTNNDEANKLLVGYPPRDGWEIFFEC